MHVVNANVGQIPRGENTKEQTFDAICGALEKIKEQIPVDATTAIAQTMIDEIK